MGEMKVVLLNDVYNLGEAGDVVEVASGYARNYLIPQEKAEYAHPAILNRIEAIKEAAQRRRRQRMEEVSEIFEEVDGETVTAVAKVGEEGKLFGSVTDRDIVDRVKEELGFTEFDSRWVQLEESIRFVGIHEVPLHFKEDIDATISVEVISEEEYEERLQAGIEEEEVVRDLDAEAEDEEEEPSGEPATEREPQPAAEGES